MGKAAPKPSSQILPFLPLRRLPQRGEAGVGIGPICQKSKLSPQDKGFARCPTGSTWTQARPPNASPLQGLMGSWEATQREAERREGEGVRLLSLHSCSSHPWLTIHWGGAGVLGKVPSWGPGPHPHFQGRGGTLLGRPRDRETKRDRGGARDRATKARDAGTETQASQGDLRASWTNPGCSRHSYAHPHPRPRSPKPPPWPPVTQ